MSDATDTQHHLEEGLLLFTRGMAFEAREAWRKVLQLDPSNPIAQDYLQSTEVELNPYDRQREAEAARQRPAPRARSGWEDDELEVIAAGPADEDEDGAERRAAVTGFAMADDDGEEDEQAASPALNGAAARWASAAAADWDGRGAEEAIEAGDEDDEEEGGSEPVKAGQGAAAAGAGRGESGDDWEPLSWMEEDTPPMAVNNRAPASSPSSPGKSAASAAAAAATAAVRSGAAGGAGKGAASAKGTGRARGTASGTFNGQPILVAAEEPSEEEVRAAQLEQSERLLSELLSGDEADEEVGAARQARAETDLVTLMSQAAQAVQDGRQELARALLLKVLEKNPSHATARKFLARIDKQLISRYQRILGSEEGVPILNPLGDLMNLNLDEVGGYILSRIDGFLTLDDIYTLSANIDRITVMRILTELIEGGIISIRR